MSAVNKINMSATGPSQGVRAPLGGSVVHPVTSVEAI